MKQKGVHYGTITVLSIAHLINDAYSNFLPQFLPFLIAMAGLSYAKATFLISVFTVSSSIVQPLIGYFIDKKGKSWLLYIGTLWMTVFLSGMGFTANYWLMVILAGFAGMGTAIFHPQASSLMGQISGQRKGFMMSVFMATGNLGFALSPLIFIPLLNSIGPKGTIYLLFPGVIIALFLLKFAKVPATSEVINQGNANPLKALADAGRELIKLITVIVIRSVVYTGLIALLPNYFKIKNVSVLVSANLMFLMLFAGAIGGMSGGWLSDRIGRKSVTVVSLLLSIPAFFIFFYTGGFLSYIMLALGGAFLMGSFSVTVVAAQEIIPANRGLASGISMGFSIGLGGLALTLVGWFADVYGLSKAIQLLFMLPGVAALIGLFMKERPAVSQTMNTGRSLN